MPLKAAEASTKKFVLNGGSSLMNQKFSNKFIDNKERPFPYGPLSFEDLLKGFKEVRK